MKKIFQEQPEGASLIIAMIFVTFIMLAMAGLVEAEQHTLRSMQNSKTEAQARWLAEGAFELARYWAGSHHGANTAELTSTDIEKEFKEIYEQAAEYGITDCATKKCAGFEVIGRSQTQLNLASVNYYSVPAAIGDALKISGSGNVTHSTGSWQAPKCTLGSKDLDNANDPCHWNKIKVGETVEIPLYYFDSAGNIVKLFGTGSDMVKFRVRSPCKELAENCADIDRILLYPSPSSLEYNDVNKDPVLIQWTISDLNGTSTLLAWDELEKQTTQRQNIFPKRQNTELTGSRINIANNAFGWFGNNDFYLKDFIVLQFMSSGLDQEKNPGKNLEKNREFIGPFISSIARPTLRLTLVAHPQKDQGNHPQKASDSAFDVPYLEYQLLTRNAPVSDTKSLISGFAELPGFRKTFEKELTRPSSGGGFALENF